MDRQLISRLAHAHHPIAAPLTDESVARLLDRATAGTDAGLALDLGCGEGAWLVRALAARPHWRAVGVDLDAAALTLARESAEALGVVRRIGLHHVDAREFSSAEPFDLVLCVGATHAFGGLLPTLAAAREHLAPGGRVLVGEGFWEREPSQAALDGLGVARDDYADLATTTDRVMAEGWTPVSGYVSSPQEWDDYEFAWTGTLAAWALDHPDHPDAAPAQAAADRHRQEWLHGYRGTFGFVTYLLRQD
ncbi:cyclopropane fatty-acyl-phospholipid synthase-like methyltransferase [Kitasatospora sp. MAA19]|uniref:SAM-dependent methyltransferase n=1 Tax=Kitasatospora sp. MAA19 TaxID=3035090 RepID=UPI002474A27F|nr:class I SAM-dependent methyltransferase [Kitasatospora sp. MAA19]MDH6710228.1 cyclopropane fatty-acyl-phospholipid synthase-like methyltransferase [Kitasatospora sp. MAA19]